MDPKIEGIVEYLWLKGQKNFLTLVRGPNDKL